MRWTMAVAVAAVLACAPSIRTAVFRSSPTTYAIHADAMRSGSYEALANIWHAKAREVCGHDHYDFHLGVGASQSTGAVVHRFGNTWVASSNGRNVIDGEVNCAGPPSPAQSAVQGQAP